MAKNGKQKMRAAARKSSKKPPKQKKEKPTAEQLSDQEKQVLFFKHKNKLASSRRRAKAAADEFRIDKEAAKKDGFPYKEFEVAFQMEEDIDKTKVAVERTHRVARWLGVGRQLDLFSTASTPTNAERHFEDGRISALNDQPAKPPSHLAQKDAQHWLEGHGAGRVARNQQLSAGFRSIGEVQRDLNIPSKVPPATDAYPPAPTDDAPHASA